MSFMYVQAEPIAGTRVVRRLGTCPLVLLRTIILVMKRRCWCQSCIHQILHSRKHTYTLTAWCLLFASCLLLHADGNIIMGADAT